MPHTDASAASSPFYEEPPIDDSQQHTIQTIGKEKIKHPTKREDITRCKTFTEHRHNKRAIDTSGEQRELKPLHPVRSDQKRFYD